MADGHARAEFFDAPETPHVSPAGDAARMADSATQATPASTSKSSADELPKSPLALVVDSARKAVSAGVARVLSLGRTVSGAERVADALAGVAEDGQLDFAERGRAKSLRYRVHATPQHVKAAVEAARTAHFALRRRVINLRRNVRDVISKEVEGALFDVQDLLLPHAETAALSAVGAEPDPSAILPSLTAPLHRSMLESFQLVSLCVTVPLALATLLALALDATRTCDGEPRVTVWLGVKLGHDAVVIACRFYVWFRCREQRFAVDKAVTSVDQNSDGTPGGTLSAVSGYTSDAELRALDRIYGSTWMRVLHWLSPFTIMLGVTGGYLARRAECYGCERYLTVVATHANTNLFMSIFLYHVAESLSLAVLIAARFPVCRTVMLTVADSLDEMLAYPIVSTFLHSFVFRKVDHALLWREAAEGRRARELVRLRAQERTLRDAHDGVERRIHALETLQHGAHAHSPPRAGSESPGPPSQNPDEEKSTRFRADVNSRVSNMYAALEKEEAAAVEEERALAEQHRLACGDGASGKLA